MATLTLYSLLCHYILTSLANTHAIDWCRGSYASILYPNAYLQSQRISEFLDTIGTDEVLRDFYSQYLPLVTSPGKLVNFAIDSRGLPNSVHFPMTAISAHNGKIAKRGSFDLRDTTGNRDTSILQILPRERC
jgi:hypothetical protein